MLWMWGSIHPFETYLYSPKSTNSCLSDSLGNDCRRKDYQTQLLAVHHPWRIDGEDHLHETAMGMCVCLYLCTLFLHVSVCLFIDICWWRWKLHVHYYTFIFGVCVKGMFACQKIYVYFLQGTNHTHPRRSNKLAVQYKIAVTVALNENHWWASGILCWFSDDKSFSSLTFVVEENEYYSQRSQHLDLRMIKYPQVQNRSVGSEITQNLLKF